MSSRRFIVFSAALFLLGALPFLILQPTAAASAGLSLGFSAPLHHLLVMVLLFVLGLLVALLPRDGMMLVPLGFILMTLLGGMMLFDPHAFGMMRYFALGAVLCMGLLVGIARQKLTVLVLMMTGSVGFHLGGFYMSEVPAIASLMYYLMGVLLSLSMVLAIAVAFGITLFGDLEPWWEQIKDHPRWRRVCRLFL